MKIYFENVVEKMPIEIDDEFYNWHRDHGWLYRVWRVEDERVFGFFAVTRLPADAGMLHFRGYGEFSFAEVRAAMKKGIALMRPVLSSIYTITESPGKMDRVLPRFGFRIIDCFARGAEHLTVWKYFFSEKTML
ncbi:MAG: hypothetical protein MJ016_02195 [Victivallaceae bacterium]|nr:hypothetical protein [Victivallaceae bacterium]